MENPQEIISNTLQSLQELSSRTLPAIRQAEEEDRQRKEAHEAIRMLKIQDSLGPVILKPDGSPLKYAVIYFDSQGREPGTGKRFGLGGYNPTKIPTIFEDTCNALGEAVRSIPFPELNAAKILYNTGVNFLYPPSAKDGHEKNSCRDEAAAHLDKFVIDPIKALAEKGLLERVQASNIISEAFFNQGDMRNSPSVRHLSNSIAMDRQRAYEAHAHAILEQAQDLWNAVRQLKGSSAEEDQQLLLDFAATIRDSELNGLKSASVQSLLKWAKDETKARFQESATAASTMPPGVVQRAAGNTNGG